MHASNREKSGTGSGSSTNDGVTPPGASAETTSANPSPDTSCGSAASNSTFDPAKAGGDCSAGQGSWITGPGTSPEITLLSFARASAGRDCGFATAVTPPTCQR